MATEQSQFDASDLVYEKFSQYPFEKDPQFLAGLQSIIQGHGDISLLDATEQDALIGRAKAFYFSRLTGKDITWDEYLAFRTTQGGPASTVLPQSSTTVVAEESTPSSQDGPAAEAILSFQEIQDLLAAGKVDEIPFNRTIPEVISEEQPSESSVAPRKKPWEVSTDS